MTPLERFPVALIDDNPDDIVLLRRTLVKTGVTSSVFPFESPLEATRFLRSFATTPTTANLTAVVVLCDLRMSEMNGFEVLKWIRAQPFSASVRVLIVSGCALEEDVERAKALGADGYIEKMPSIEALREGIVAPAFPVVGTRAERFRSWEVVANKR